jgi:hypothetical protein
MRFRVVRDRSRLGIRQDRLCKLELLATFNIYDLFNILKKKMLS